MKFVPVFQDQVVTAGLDLEQLTDNIKSLCVTLRDKAGGGITLTFESHMAYRARDEGDAMVTLDLMSKSGGTGKYFYEVEESDFIAWFNAERYEASTDAGLKHYCIASTNFIVDVIATEPPVFAEQQ
jgi:hypothetical protein